MSLPSARVNEAMESHLMALASQSNGDLRQLLHAFFGFLHRRTDFYVLQDGNGKMGFKEGEAEKVLLAAFRQFPLRKIPKQDPPAPKASDAAEAAIEARAAADDQKATPNESKPPQKDDSETIRHTEEGLQIPVGNGGSTDRYKWTQTIEECSVLVGIPEGTKAKELSVVMKTKNISVKKGDDIFVEGPLTQEIVPSESTWTLEGGVLILVLYKRQKTFWKTVIEGDPEIDASLVDSRRHIDEYDAATQGQIRKILFDQNQERRGLPTSDQIAGRTIPPLPDGVEYIDQDVLDQKTKKSTD